jgi:SPP1 family predicted phage head-tail adaptor
MRIGQRDRIIIIEQRSTVPDGLGGETETWATYRPTWAGILNLSGNERRFTKHGGEVVQAFTEFNIRYIAGVTEEMRIRSGGKIYNIKHVNDINEEHVEMVLSCDVGVNDG